MAIRVTCGNLGVCPCLGERKPAGCTNFAEIPPRVQLASPRCCTAQLNDFCAYISDADWPLSLGVSGLRCASASYALNHAEESVLWGENSAASSVWPVPTLIHFFRAKFVNLCVRPPSMRGALAPPRVVELGVYD